MKVKIGNYPTHRFYHNWLYALGWSAPAEKVKVHIDPWDTWSMDSTLAHIVVPMLEQLRETTHGAPTVEDIDRPEHLIGTVVDPHHVQVDEFHFQAWDWVLSEMLFAYKSKQVDWQEYFYCSDENDSSSSYSGFNAYQDRITNGFRLFGKYYESLWD